MNVSAVGNLGYGGIGKDGDGDFDGLASLLRLVFW